jgi:hypothetical protein
VVGPDDPRHFSMGETMTENNNDGPTVGLDRTFAPMLSELEDAEVKLVAEHAKAVAEVRRLDAELGRLQKVKSMMLGEPKAKRAASSTTRRPSAQRGDTPEGREQAARNRERVVEYITTLQGGAHFTAADLSKALDLPPQGLGPILSGMERNGLVENVGMTGERQPRKRYRKAQDLAT